MPDVETNRELARRIDAKDVAWFQERYQSGELAWIGKRLSAADYEEIGRRIEAGDLGWVGTMIGTLGLEGFNAAGPLLERAAPVARPSLYTERAAPAAAAAPRPEVEVAPTAPEPDRKRRKAWLLIPLLAVLAVLGFLLTRGGGDDDGGAGPATTAAPTTLTPAVITALADESGRLTISGKVGTDAAAATVMDALRVALPNRVIGGLAVDPKAPTTGLTLDLVGRAREPAASQLRGAVNALPDVTVRDQLQVVTAPALEVEINALLKAEPIQFDTGSAIIRPASNGTLDKLAALLQATPTGQVMFEGHTDSAGSAAKNLALSQARADAVKAALVTRGVDATRLKAKGYGSERPIADNATAEGRQQNRRVEALVTP